MDKVAILIDGGYLLKRLPALRLDINVNDAKTVADSIEQLVREHLQKLNAVYQVPNKFQLLYRSFYYDARPYIGRVELPVGKKAFNYGESRQAIFRRELFHFLRGRPNFAVRLGEVNRNKNRPWIMDAKKQKQLLNKEINVDALDDKDFQPGFRQKGVDLRIGLDIASITLKRQANIIILVSGDADFVPAAKLARREGAQFILDPLWQDIPADLHEHIDALRNGFSEPKKHHSNRR